MVTWAGAGPSSQGDGAQLAREPFRTNGWRNRILPFTVVAVLAELSVVLPSGPKSIVELLVSIGLLVAVAGSFWLPWNRVPQSATVIVPLAYLASILFLVLATGQSSSGIGIIILTPVIWCALFHREWESACLVVGVVIVEVITSLTPIEVPTSVLIRRLLFWLLLSMLTAVAIHALRRREAVARTEQRRLHDQLQDLALVEDRERIARELHESTIHRIMSVGLHLEGARGLSHDGEVTKRIRQAVKELDETITTLRRTIFDAELARSDGQHRVGVQSSDLEDIERAMAQERSMLATQYSEPGGPAA